MLKSKEKNILQSFQCHVIRRFIEKKLINFGIYNSNYLKVYISIHTFYIIICILCNPSKIECFSKLYFSSCAFNPMKLQNNQSRKLIQIKQKMIETYTKNIFKKIKIIIIYQWITWLLFKWSHNTLLLQYQQVRLSNLFKYLNWWTYEIYHFTNLILRYLCAVMIRNLRKAVDRDERRLFSI